MEYRFFDGFYARAPGENAANKWQVSSQIDSDLRYQANPASLSAVVAIGNRACLKQDARALAWLKLRVFATSNVDALFAPIVPMANGEPGYVHRGDLLANRR